MQLKIIENGQEIDLENLNEEFIRKIGEDNPFMGFILTMAHINHLTKESLKEELVEETLDFSDALDLLKEGYKLQRKGWNGKGMFVYFVPAGIYNPETEIAKQEFGDNVPYGGYLAIKTVQGYVVPWIPSQIDLLAEDYIVIENN